MSKTSIEWTATVMKTVDRRAPRRQKDPARDTALTRQFHAMLSDPRRWPKSWPIIRVDIRMLGARR